MVFVTSIFFFSCGSILCISPSKEKQKAFFDKLSYFHAFEKTNEITLNLAVRNYFNSFLLYTFFAT